MLKDIRIPVTIGGVEFKNPFTDEVLRLYAPVSEDMKAVFNT